MMPNEPGACPGPSCEPRPPLPHRATPRPDGSVPTLAGRVPFLATIARPRLGCAGPVVPGGLAVLVVCCPARRVRDYPGGSGPPGGSGTPWGPRSTRQAISTRLSAAPWGARGTRGRRGEQEPAGQGFRRGGRFAGRGRAEATRPPPGSPGRVVPGGPDLPRLPDRRPGPRRPGPVRRTPRMAAPAGRARGDASHRDRGLDHQPAYRAGRTAVGFIKDHSNGQAATTMRSRSPVERELG